MENNNEKSGGMLEFTFDDPQMSGGLVFEAEAPAKSESAPQDGEKENIVGASENKAPLGNEDASENKAIGIDEEFGVPETFKVNEKYNTPIRENERTRIYTTYVPRFTEVSETYRMKNDPRPRPKTSEPPIVAKEEKKTNKVEAVEVADVPKFEMAQESSSNDDTVVVNISEPAIQDLSSEESINVFKFPEEELSPSDRMNIEEENANRKALEELKARQAKRREQEESERRAALEAEALARMEQRNTKLSPEDYQIPDPERTGFVDRHSAFSIDKDYTVPHGIPTDSEKTRKLKVSEYTSAGQRDTFKDRFLDSLVAVKIRIAAVVLIAVLALLFENSSIFGFDSARLLGIEYMPSANAIIDFQFALCAFLLTLPETIRAVKHLIGKTVLCSLAMPLSFIALLVYTLIISSPKYYMDYPLFGFLFVLSALFALLATYLRRKTEFESFKFISVKGEKKIIEHEETRKYARTMLALDGAIDGYRSNTAKTFRTTFVSDFFSNSAKASVNSKNNLILLAAAVGVALVAALVSFFTADIGAICDAAAAFAFVLVFAFPAASYISHSLPYYHAGKEVAGENSAIIGECAYTDTAAVDVIAFEDTEIFGEDDVNLKRFGFYGNEDNMNKCMRQISSLFASIGGPLNLIFSKTLEKRCTPAADPIIEDDGVCGNVDGKIVCAGTAEYMLRRGINIPEDNDRVHMGIGSESMKIMYGAEGGVIFAKFYIRYSFSEEFTSLLPALRDEHIVPLVYTSDPNISNDLFRTLTMGADCMRVMKRKVSSSESEKIYPRISASVVTSGDTVNAIRLVLIARKYKRFSDKLAKAEIIAASSCIGAAALLSVFGLSVPTLVLGAVQLAASGVLWFFSKKRFNIKKDKAN